MSKNSQNKLPPVDSLVARILIANAEHRVNFLHTILPKAPNSQSSGKELTDFVGQEIGRLISEQRTIQDRSAQLQRRKINLQDPAQAAELAVVKSELSDCSNQLKESFTQLYRWMEQSPDIDENKAKTKADRLRILNALEIARIELDFESSFEKLTEFVQAEKYDLGRLEELRKQDKDLQKEIQDLARDLNWEKDQYAKECASAESTVRALKEELAKLRSVSAMEVDFENQKLAAENSVKMHEFYMKSREMDLMLDKANKAIEQEKRFSSTMLKTLSRHVVELTETRAKLTEKSETDVMNMEKIKIPDLAEKQKLCSAELEVLRARKIQEIEELNQAEIREKQLAAQAEWRRRNQEELPKTMTLLQNVGRKFLEGIASRGTKKKGKTGKKKSK